MLSKEGSNLNLLINSDYLDSEIYSHSKPKEYEYFSCKFPPPPNKSFSKYDASSSSYQNNTIIENTKNCFSEEMNLNEYEKTLSLQKKSLTHYKLLTDIIEDHLDKKEHPLNILKEKFIEQFVNYFEEIQPNPIFSNRNEKFTLMILNLLEFIRIFQHSVILFYGLISSKIFLKSMCYFTQENFLQFITSLFLNDPKIYNLLFQLSYEVNHDIEEKIERNYKNFTNLHPEAFGISKELCLNNKTIKFFKGEEDTSTNTFKLKEPTEQNFDHIFKGKITWDADDEYGNEIEYSSLKSPLILKDFMGFKNSCTIEEKNKILNQVSSNEDFCKNIRKSLAVRTMVLSEHKQTRKSIKIFDKKKSDIFRFSFENAPPYELAILNLKKISKLRSPIHKLKNILKTAVLIIDCIKQFYSKFQKDFSNEKEINSDEIMSILIYICCKGEIKGLFSQCALIESFLTNQISTSVAGYYLITLKASLEYISSEEILMKNQEKNN